MSVAETVCPSVRGAEGMQVALLLAGSGALSGAAAGLVAGVVWAGVGLGRVSPGLTAVVTALAVSADVIAARRGGPRPLAVQRQVPQAWGRLFGARLAATLYGTRLGIGPLTILRTWTWWAALVVGASLGPWPSAAVGATFALARTATTLVVTGRTTDGVAMRRRMTTLRHAEPGVFAATAAVLTLVAVGLVLP